MLRASKCHPCIFPISSPTQMARFRNILQHLPRYLRHLISDIYKLLLNNKHIPAKRISTTLSLVGAQTMSLLEYQAERNKQIGPCISFLLLL